MFARARIPTVKMIRQDCMSILSFIIILSNVCINSLIAHLFILLSPMRHVIMVITFIYCFCRPEDASKALEASQGKTFFGAKIKVTSHEGVGKYKLQ